MIPKILLQISSHVYPQYLQDMWQERVDDMWSIYWFDDDKIIQYFKDNPLPEFPNILAVFNSFERGAHKADLFRYYFMYINGGIFIDSDAITHVSLNDLVKDNKDYFFTISTLPFNDLQGSKGCMFNGFYGCIPRSHVVYELLKNAYTTDAKTLKRFNLYFTCMMYNIVSNSVVSNAEYYYEDASTDGGKVSFIRKGDLVICSHYNTDKIVPGGIKIK